MNNKTEEQFLKGVRYEIIDAVLELVLFVVIILYLNWRVHVDIVKVGKHIMAQHTQYFFWMTIAACMYFQDM